MNLKGHFMKTIANTLVLIITIILSVQVNGQNSAGQIIDMIIKNTGSPLIPNTVDVIKEGNPETNVTGIVTTMFATMEVLKKAVAEKCNLIIVHEPLYYNHTDQTSQFQNDPVYLEKSRYIRENKLVIWRFHDYIHSIKPDGIMSGMVKKLEWEKYVVNGNLSQYLIPETTLDGLLKYLKQIFPVNAFYVIGNRDMKLSRVRFAAGAPGSSTHFRLLQDPNVDVVLAGESPQWETYEYMHDAVSQGRPKAIIFLGHVSSEEAGMDYCASWLKTFVKEIPVKFIESGPSYWSY
jgi:putative NIF3 family GTP cyclohydrolase 1 type 2